MPEIEVHIDLDERTREVGLARRNLQRGSETILFEYAGAWLADPAEVTRMASAFEHDDLDRARTL